MSVVNVRVLVNELKIVRSVSKIIVMLSMIRVPRRRTTVAILSGDVDVP